MIGYVVAAYSAVEVSVKALFPGFGFPITPRSELPFPWLRHSGKSYSPAASSYPESLLIDRPAVPAGQQEAAAFGEWFRLLQAVSGHTPPVPPRPVRR